MNTPLLPLVWFDSCTLPEANELLVRWQHRMGELKRGNQGAWSNVLCVEGEPVAVTTASYLISGRVGNAKHLTRDNTVELSRLCAVEAGWCRVAIRLWRNVVFPQLPFEFAMSYQDADLHSGNTYRFDGWQRVAMSRSGTDTRSGRAGRNKWIWMWPKLITAMLTLCVVFALAQNCQAQSECGSAVDCSATRVAARATAAQADVNYRAAIATPSATPAPTVTPQTTRTPWPTATMTDTPLPTHTATPEPSATMTTRASETATDIAMPTNTPIVFQATTPAKPTDFRNSNAAQIVGLILILLAAVMLVLWFGRRPTN